MDYQSGMPLPPPPVDGYHPPPLHHINDANNPYNNGVINTPHHDPMEHNPMMMMMPPIPLTHNLMNLNGLEESNNASSSAAEIANQNTIPNTGLEGGDESESDNNPDSKNLELQENLKPFGEKTGDSVRNGEPENVDERNGEDKGGEDKEPSRPQTPDIDTVLETDDFELMAGNDIIHQADHIFRLKQGRKFKQIVTKAFRVMKKNTEVNKPKKVKVVITSKANLEKAMELSVLGRAEEVLSKLREKPAPEIRIKKKHEVKKEEEPSSPVNEEVQGESDIPPWHIMEQVQAAMDKAMKEANFPDLDDGDGYGDDGFDDDFDNYDDSMDNTDTKATRKRKLDYTEYDDDEDFPDWKDVKIKAEPGEEIYGEDIINQMQGEPVEQKPIKLKLTSKKIKKKRGKRKRDTDDEDFDLDLDLEEKPKKTKKAKSLTDDEPKEVQQKIPNTLDKNLKLDSFNLDDYIVMVSADNSAAKKRPTPVKTEPGPDEEVKETGEKPKETELDEDDDLYNINFGKTIKYFGCTFCDFTGKKIKWIRHLKSKHKDQGIVFCTRNRVCMHPFNSQELLDQHTKEMHEEKNKCKICNRCFKYPRDLRNHLPSHKSKEELEESGVGKHICPYCGKEFNTRAAYKTHEAQTHTMNLNHKCDFEGCDKAFYKLSSLKIHRRGHTGEKPFVCSYCGTGFVAKQRLVVHEKTMHLSNEEDLDTECHICHKKLRKRYLKYHIATTHEGKTQDSCRVCGKIFPTTPARKRHEKIHFDVKDFACRFCGKAFVQKANMLSHERTHTGEKPYQCKFCGEGFVQGTRRNVHQASCRQRPLVV